MKITNYRPIVFVTISLLIGVMVGGLVYNNTAFLILVPVALIAMGIFLYFVFKKKIIFFLILFFCIGIVSFAVDYNISFSGNVNSENVYVKARVKETKDNYLILEDLSLDGRKYKGKATLEYIDTSDIEIGDKVTFIGSVTTNDVDIFDFYLMSKYNDRIFYDTTINRYLKVDKGELKLFEKVKGKIIRIILENMPAEEAGVAISLVFGDKKYISKSDNEVIRNVGLSHIFSVSGLHVGFLVALIIFICKKMRIKPKTQLVVIMSILLVYGLLTGLPSGVKRAAVMSIIYLLSVILGRKNDNLNTLSLSVLLIVLLNPKELFDISFIMSVSSILGIVCFYSPIQKFLQGKSYNKLRKYLASGIAATVSANIFLIPISFNVFNSFATYMIISNLLVLPLVTLAYTAIMPIIMGSLLFESIGTLHKIVSYPISFVRHIAELINSLPSSTVSVGSLGVLTAFYLVIAIVLTRFIMLEKNKKLIFSGVFSTLGAFLFVIL